MEANWKSVMQLSQCFIKVESNENKYITQLGIMHGIKDQNMMC